MNNNSKIPTQSNARQQHFSKLSLSQQRIHGAMQIYQQGGVQQQDNHVSIGSRYSSAFDQQQTHPNKDIMPVLDGSRTQPNVRSRQPTGAAKPTENSYKTLNQSKSLRHRDGDDSLQEEDIPRRNGPDTGMKLPSIRSTRSSKHLDDRMKSSKMTNSYDNPKKIKTSGHHTGDHERRTTEELPCIGRRHESIENTHENLLDSGKKLHFKNNCLLQQYQPEIKIVKNNYKDDFATNTSKVSQDQESSTLAPDVNRQNNSSMQIKLSSSRKKGSKELNNSQEQAYQDCSSQLTKNDAEPIRAQHSRSVLSTPGTKKLKDGETSLGASNCQAETLPDLPEKEWAVAKQHTVKKEGGKYSKAQREKELTTLHAHIREREMLRDWIRRHVIEREGSKAKNEPLSGSPHPVKNVNQKNLQEQQQVELVQQEIKNNKPLNTKVNEDIPDMIVFQNNARDNFFKLAAERKALKEGLWVQNYIQASYFYRVKWDYGDNNFDYKKQQPHQFFNHFPDTRELTTKQGLNKNLNSITEPGTDISAFYPRCYDLSISKQLDLFIADYNQTSILNVVAKHSEYFKTLISQQPDKLRQTLETAIEDNTQDYQVNFNTFRHAKKVKRDLSHLQFQRCCQADFGSININLLQLALYYCQDLLNKTAGFDLLNVPYHCDEFFKKNCFLPEYKLTDNQMETLQLYGEIVLPLRRRQLQNPSLSKLRKVRGWTPILNVGQSQMFQLDLYLVFLTIKVHRQLERYWPQYRTVNGTNNVWICKPCYNARGLGIFCFNKKADIISTFSKKAPTPKVVQKYVERPLLLRGVGSSNKSELRKFDIRQWVLVTSLDPLHVYVFKDAYLRICGSHYDINQFEDAIRHLSNYSLQKKELAHQTTTNFQKATTESEHPDEEQTIQQQSQNEFVMSTEQLIARLNDQSQYPEYAGKNITWQETFLPQITDITRKVFAKMTEVMEHSNNSFELFGFDFLIDEQLQCWLLEANMSPACAVRKGQQWLSDMVENMADGMLNIVEHKILQNMLSTKLEYQGPIAEKLEQLKNHQHHVDVTKWELLDFSSPSSSSSPSHKPEASPRFHKWNTHLDKKSAFRPTLKYGPAAQKTMTYFNPQAHLEHLEVIGKSHDLKTERKVHRFYLSTMAATLIQRVFRGYRNRRDIKDQQVERLHELKKTAALRKLIKVLEPQVSQQQSDSQQKEHTALLDSFRRMQETFWLSRIDENEERMKKVISLQRQIRAFHKDKALTKTGSKLRPLRTHPSSARNRSQSTISFQEEGSGPDYYETPVVYRSSPRSRGSQRPSSAEHLATGQPTKQHDLDYNKQRRRLKYQSNKPNITSIDPNLLLNYASLGVEMLIPAKGRFFQFQGGMQFKRATSENPIEVEQLHELQQQQAELTAQLFAQTAKQISPYLQRLNKKSIYDIYAEGAGRSTFAVGFNAKKSKQAKDITSSYFEHKKSSYTQLAFANSQTAGNHSSEKKNKDWNKGSSAKPSQAQTGKNMFSNKAVNRRINEGIRDTHSFPCNFLNRLNQAIKTKHTHSNNLAKIVSNSSNVIPFKQSSKAPFLNGESHAYKSNQSPYLQTFGSKKQSMHQLKEAQSLHSISEGRGDTSALNQSCDKKVMYNFKPKSVINGIGMSTSKKKETLKQHVAQTVHNSVVSNQDQTSTPMRAEALAASEERSKAQSFKASQALQLLKTTDAFFKKRALMQNTSSQSRKFKALGCHPNASLLTNIYTPVLKNFNNSEQTKNRKQNGALRTAPHQHDTGLTPVPGSSEEGATASRASKKSKLTEIQEIYSHHDSSTATFRHRSSHLQSLQMHLIREQGRRC